MLSSAHDRQGLGSRRTKVWVSARLFGTEEGIFQGLHCSTAIFGGKKHAGLDWLKLCVCDIWEDVGGKVPLRLVVAVGREV